MIIKSMSRKAPTFKQLIEYIGQNSDPQTGSAFARNLYHSGANADLVAGQFMDNYQFLPKRKNGNALYHEVIVLERQDHLTRSQIETALHDLANTYCAKRAPHQLAWGRVHWDTNYPHIHLMISSNAVRSDRRVRMEKAQFAQLQRTMEGYKEQQFPALVGGRIYQKERHDHPKIINREGEMVRRQRQPSAKQIVAGKIKDVLLKSAGRKEIVVNLQASGFDIYQRGKTVGVIHHTTGRKYRLRTLGLDAAFENALLKHPKNRKHIDLAELNTITERNSAPSPKTNPSLTNEEALDPRAKALKNNRSQLNAQARDLLDGFERDEENGR